MRVSKLMLAGAALAMSATPVMAAYPAAKLSVGSVRASADSDKESAFLGGGSLAPILAILAVGAVILISAADDDSPSSP